MKGAPTSNISDVADAARVPVLHLSGMELIRYEDAEAVVLEVASRGLRLLGWDGFEYNEQQEWVRPCSDWIADFSPAGLLASELLKNRRLLFSTTPDPHNFQTGPGAKTIALDFVLLETP